MKEIVTRDIQRPHDDAFILDSWLRSYYGNSDFAECISNAVFFNKHKALANKLLDRGHARLAVDAEAPEIILGYIVFEQGVVHYLYVKKAFQGFGIAKTLLMENGFFEGTIITHLTHAGRKLQLRCGFVYSPYFNDM